VTEQRRDLIPRFFLFLFSVGFGIWVVRICLFWIGCLNLNQDNAC
jgi:hypothetical protein